MPYKTNGQSIVETEIMKKETSRLKISIGENRLTTAAMKNLQIFYGLATKSNIHSLDRTKQVL